MNLHIPAVLAALLIAGPALAETLREQSEATTNVRGFSSLEVENSRGRVEVRPGAEGRIRIVALKIVRAIRESDRRALAEATSVETDVEGGRYVVRVRYPQKRSIRVNLWQGFSTATLPRTEVRLAIEVPPSFPVSLHSASGDLSTEGLRGRQLVKTASGDVRVESASGAVEVSTASGDVEGNELRSATILTVSGDISIDRTGALHARSASGDVGIRTASDSLDVETVSGDIEVGVASRGLNARSASGEIRVDRAAQEVRIGTVSGGVHAGLGSPLRGAKLKSTSGSIVAELDQAIACTLEMRTASGSIDLEIPARTRTVSRRFVTATIRDGTTPIQVESVSGDITITGRSR